MTYLWKHKWKFIKLNLESKWNRIYLNTKFDGQLKSGTTVAPRENLTRLKVRQVHKTVGLISWLETCMAIERLLHLQCAFCRKTGQNGLKLPVFRLKSGTTVAPRENVTRFKVPQVHKTVGLISRLETCMAFARLLHLQGVFCQKTGVLALKCSFSD